MQSKNRKIPVNTLVMLIFSIIILFVQILPNGGFSNSIEKNIDNSQIPYQPLDLDGILPIGNITVLSIDNLGEGTFINESVDPVNGMASPYSIQFEYLTEFPSAFLGVKHIGDENSYSPNTQDGALLFTINESVRYDYWYNDTKTITNFRSALSGSSYSGISNITINGTELDYLNHSIFSIVDDNYVLNYSSFLSGDQYPNGTLIVGYEIDYLLRFNEWQMIQTDMYQENNEPAYLDDFSTNINANYNYSFGLGGALTDNLDMNLTLKISIPDKDYLNIKSMSNYTGIITEVENVTTFDDYTLNPNNTVEIEINLRDYAQYSIDSEAEFTIEFVQTYTSFWHKDYLYTNRDVRERQYIISCVDGPPSLAASYFSFNISSIPYEDLIEINSEYVRNGAQGRQIYAGNMSEFNDTVGTIVFSYEDQNSQQYKLFTGETDLITVTYRAWRTLNITLTDHINIPISGVSIEVLYQNVTYGTQMSAESTYQIPIKISDFNGELNVPNMPYGEFIISIYYNGEFIQNSTVSTIVEMNRIITSIPHFPTTILIFLITSIVIAGIGFYIYKKYQN